MRHIIPISGKDSLCTAIVQITREPGLDYEFMYNPTGAELPCVFEWLDRVSEYFGKEIVHVGEDLEALIESYNFFLPSGQARYCTREAKIEPMERFIGKEPATIYLGIRADEDRIGYRSNSNSNIISVCPLQDLGIGIEAVYAINHKVGLMPPNFRWESVYREVCRRIGWGDEEKGEEIIKALFRPWQIDALFAWRSRMNCYFCFNQRLYEYVGLLEHEPQLFERMSEIEKEGQRRSNKTYYWYGGKQSAEEIRGRAEEIKEKRIRAIVKFINKVQQGDLFAKLEDEAGFLDMLSVKSCGLFCGK